MKAITQMVKSLLLLGVIVAVLFPQTSLGGSQIAPGEIAPSFSLNNVGGALHDLSEMKERPMMILYFFDAESSSSQEGLLSLNELEKKHADSHLEVWGITLSAPENVEAFLSKTKITFPILLDTTGVSDLYQARFVLPTVCILGPGLSVIDYFQGGGKTTEIMLTQLAQRMLQRKKTAIAKAITEQVVKENPKNNLAKAIKGYAALKEGDLEEAEKTFATLSEKKDDGQILGNEGLAAVYAQKGDTKTALKLADKVERSAPDRGFVHVVKGNILFSQNKQQEAEAEYKRAVQKGSAESFQKAVAYNQLGRMNARQGKYDQARALYDMAVEMDPFYVEATSNKGVTYEKEGRWNDALKSYRMAMSLDRNDPFSAILTKKAQEMLTSQQNVEKKKRIDKLVKELAERFRNQKKLKKKVLDTWTSRPMVITFVDFQEKGGLPERDGLPLVLTSRLSDSLDGSGRVQVVERVLMERLLEELNLGSSELADPETALQLGNVLAAKLIGTGTIFHLPDRNLLTLRLIDSETSAIPKVMTTELATDEFLEEELNRLNREILKTVVTKYPLQGFVVQSQGDQILINLGSKQGVVLGTKFEVIVESDPIEYKGKLLRGLPKSVGLLEVVQVGTDLSHARILEQKETIEKDAKVREKVEDVVAMGDS